MQTKHVFVPALDVSELLPFVVKKTETLQQSMEEQERARKELVKFIDNLEKNYKETIFYMGMDVIETKNYERFIFQNGGFFEIMTESPLAMNAHFVQEDKAKKFRDAFRKTLKSVLKKDEMSDMFINSIEVSTEKDESLTFEKWDVMKNIREK